MRKSVIYLLDHMMVVVYLILLAGGLLIAPYANALSTFWLINLGLCDGGSGIYAFHFVVCFVFDLVVLLCSVSPNLKLVSLHSAPW